MINSFDRKNFLICKGDGVYLCNTVWGWHTHDDGNTTFTFVAPYPMMTEDIQYALFNIAGICATPDLDMIVLETTDNIFWRLPFTYSGAPYERGGWLSDGEQAP